MKNVDLVGRDGWRSRLAPLPFVTLLRAPSSTGKRTAALWAAQQAGVSPLDTQLFPALEWRDEYGREASGDAAAVAFEPELSISHVRELSAWARKAPMSSPFKIAVVRLDQDRSDGTSWVASARSQAAMLKLLEEPPASTRFVLCSQRAPSPMIRSRAVELSAGLLTADQVADIVFAVSELSRSESVHVAALGGGRVGPSLAARSRVEGSVQAVVNVLHSLVAGDQTALMEASRIWTDVDTELLNRWAHECVTQKWSVFADAGAPAVSASAADRVLRVVGMARGARPRVVLGAVAALAAGA